MTYKRLSLRILTLIGLVLGILVFTMTMLTLVQADDPAVTIVKEADQVVVSGSTVTFTIAITNTGDVTLTNVIVSDPLAPDCARVIGDPSELAPQESTSYECTLAGVTTDFTNSATVTGTDTVSGTNASDYDTASVDVINPTIAIAKTPDSQVVRYNSTVTFTIAITNTGDVTLANVIVSDPLAPDCARLIGDPSELAPQESTSYECALASVTTDFTNSATVTGTDTLSGTNVSDYDTVFVDVINPTIAIAKTPDSQVVRYNSTVTFTIAITNTGDVTLTNVTVSDAQAPFCNQGIGDLPELAPQESTSYECTLANVTTDFTNSATVTGTDVLLATDATGTGTAFVDVINPTIEIAKTPDVQTVVSGTIATFTIVVTNTGDVPLTNVIVSDAQAPLCNRSLGVLPADDSASYGCTLANVTDGFINSAIVTGRPPLGDDVTNADAAKVKLSETLPCPTDMIAYWKLDEATGPTYDDFYDGHDGECAGSCPAPAAGHVNGGQEFNGSNTGIDVSPVPGDDSLDWGPTDSFSIEFWMKRPGTPTGNEVIVGRDDSATGLHWWTGVGHWAGDVAAFCLYDTDGTGTCLTGEAVVTDGDWHHIVAVRDASVNEIRIYVDGTAETLKSVTYSAGFDSTAALNIGNLGGGYHFDGTVDEVALYDRALSADEIRQHHNEGLAGRWYCQPGTYTPTIVSTPVTEATVGRPYSYDVEAAGNPTPTYTLVVSPTGMTTDPVTGLISWTPTIAQEGDHAVKVQASNTEGTATQSFTITVHEGTLCPTEMIAYWKLDESSGPTYGDFYDGHDGACAGTCPISTTGRINVGQEFNGSNTGIDVPADEAFDWGPSDSFSIEFWMRRPGTPTGNEVIVGRDDSATGLHWWAGVGHWAGDVAAFCLYETDGTGMCLTGNEEVVTGGDWHHIVAVRDAAVNELRIYVDGEEDGSVESPPYSAGFASTAAALDIGNLGGGYHFDGTIDEVALYDRALSSDEISQHYNNGEPSPGYCINPDIAVAKTADSEMVYAGEWVTYTCTVTNPGDTPLSDVSLSDDKCSSVTLPVGDDDGDDQLDPTETWIYQCQMALSADITNTATVTGTHSLNGTVNNTDTAFVDVRDSTLTISKEANDNDTVFGFTVTYGGSSEPFDLKNGEWTRLSDLAPGSYQITEEITSEWELVSITCTNGVSLIAPDVPTVIVDLQSGQDVSCTFTNYSQGQEEGPYPIFLPIVLRE